MLTEGVRVMIILHRNDSECLTANGEGSSQPNQCLGTSAIASSDSLRTFHHDADTVFEIFGVVRSCEQRFASSQNIASQAFTHLQRPGVDPVFIHHVREVNRLA